ncbi:MAG TPA: BON domain-containing protein [Micromonosporaceae bacterium]
MSGPQDEYVEAAVQRLLAEHPNLGEQGLVVVRHERDLILRGEVESRQRRDEIERLVAEHFPGVRVRCDIGVVRSQPPSEAEELS